MNDQRPSHASGTGTGGTVLVCDYVGRRSEAPVSSLNLEARGYTVHYLLKPPYPRELTAAAYADELLRRHGPLGTDVRAVLAYCMAASIAQEVAAAVSAATGTKVPLVLFDGEPATARSVQEQYLLAAAKLGELLALDGPDRTPPPIEPELLRDQPEEARQRIHEGLLELGARAARRGALTVEIVRAESEMFAAYYLDWLGHLIAAHQASWPAWGGRAVQIASRSHPCPATWPGAGSTETVRIEASRDELLRNPEVASIILSILAAEVSSAV